MKVSGLLLLVLGVIALVYGGISYSRQRTIVDIGGFKATATEHKNFPMSPVVGGVAMIAGVLLLAVPRRRFA